MQDMHLHMYAEIAATVFILWDIILSVCAIYINFFWCELGGWGRWSFSTRFYMWKLV